jgi:hypothetical protein
MQYPDVLAAVQIYCQQVAPNTGIDFAAITPVLLNAAELRIYRDMPLLAAEGQNTTLICVPGNPLLSLAALPGQVTAPVVLQGGALAYPNPLTVRRVALLVPGIPPALNGWVEFLRVSLDLLQNIWPQPTEVQVPVIGSSYWAMQDDVSIYVAPTPPQPYQVRVIGLWRPAPMSGTNPETYLGDVLPDLLVASLMLEASGYMQNYGSQADDPKMAVSWLQMYQSKLEAAKREERMRRGLAPEPPAPQAAAAGAP